MEQPLVYAIVVTYNGSHMIGRMLKSLQKTKYPNLKILVVDNGSSDGSAELVRKEFPTLEVLEFQPNRGFGGANNLATKHIVEQYKPDYVIWLNDDMEIVDPDWLAILVETAQRKKAGVIGCKLIFPDKRIQYAGGFFHPFKITTHRGLFESDSGQYNDEIEVGYVNGACFMIHKNVIEKIGLIDEGYYPIYFEEADYCARAKRNGFKIIYTGKTRIIHYTSATSKKEDNEKRYKIWEKNRIRFVLSNFPFYWWPFSFLKIFASVFIIKNEQNKTVIASNPLNRLGMLFNAFKEARK